MPNQSDHAKLELSPLYVLPDGPGNNKNEK
jgi:hypothetical protein